MLTKYIWQGKRDRCSYKYLIKHPRAGGMGLVNFKDYYYAVILEQLQVRKIDPLCPRWKQLEEVQVESHDLKIFMLAALW